MPRSPGLCVGAILALAFAGSAEAAMSVHGSARQVYATGVAPGAKMALVNAKGHRVAGKRADSLGGLLFRNVKPGSGYRIRPAKGGAASAPVTVFSTRSAPPSADIYNQSIPSKGYGYLTTRDGTKLAIDVHPAQDVTQAAGIDLPSLTGNAPTPTLIEYS